MATVNYQEKLTSFGGFSRAQRATNNVARFHVEPGTLQKIDIWSDFESGTVVFTMKKNGVDQFPLTENRIVMTGGVATKTGLSITVADGDIISFDLISFTTAGLTAPVYFRVSIDDGESGGGGGGITEQIGTPSDSPDVSESFPARFNVSTSNLWIFDGTLWNAFQPYAQSDPTDPIPFGLPLWARYEAEYEAGIADGDPFTQLTDRSINGRDGVAVVDGAIKRAADINGLASYDFTAGSSGSYFSLPSMAALTQGEVFFILKSDADPAADNNGTIHSMGTDAASGHYPYTSGDIYDGFGVTARQTCGNPTEALNAWHCLNIESSASNYKMRINGNTLFTNTTTPGFSATPFLGMAASGINPHYKGRMAGIYIMSEVLNGTQRGEMETFITNTYGITF